MTRLIACIGVFLLSVLFFSCKKKEEVKVVDKNAATYFSIKDFVKDQWKTYHGQPLMVVQYTTFNNQKDSVLLSALTMKWSLIFQTFFETDISDPKFLDQYEFTMFEEETTQTRNFSYVAKDPALFTQKLQIAADVFTNKIRNVYIETQKQSFWNTQTKKLLYSPMHVLQIQEHDNPLIGGNKDLVIEYKFM